jgi:iron complex outermembrane receptor protein
MRHGFPTRASCFTALIGSIGFGTLVSAPLLAQDVQTGSVVGRITEAATSAGLVGARVQLYALPGRADGPGATSGEDGAYRIGAVRPGTYALQVTRIGYAPGRVDTVRVQPGQAATVNVTLTASPSQLSEVVVTASGTTAPERVQDSPNAITAIPQVRITERAAVTVTDHIKAVPGLAISQGGIMQANIVSRGFNNAFSTTMLMLQDYRFAGVPSLRVNVPALFTGTGDDIERIEVLQGPAAALYGPNSGNGVLHIITKSPFRSRGTTITLDGGTRSFGRLAGRAATVLPGDRLALKVSGEYFRAKDFEYVDPNEPARFSTTDTRVPTSRRGAVASRDFDVNKASGEARLDFRPDSNTEFITTAGMSRIGRGLEITTTFGAAQVRNWSYLNLQERFRHKKFFAQVFYNKSNSGNESATDDAGTYYLRTGIPVVDKSSVLVGQAQQALQLGRTQFVVGGEYIATRPQTEGSINGRNEGNDDVNEAGGYIQTKTALTSMLDLLLAGRIDMNSRVEGTQFSPRAALVFKPTTTHTFRATFNRAFGSPAPYSFFLDQYSGQTPAPGLPVQILGNPPKQGWNYARTCTGAAVGTLCMRSPYIPNTLAPASAAAAFPGFAQ